MLTEDQIQKLSEDITEAISLKLGFNDSAATLEAIDAIIVAKLREAQG
ncbi:hypothetical protein ACI4B7_26015 [Klebsiella pneumoniae]